MAKKIFSMLFEDFHWKLLALVAAAVIWFIGMHMSDPPQSLSVSPRLRLDNFEIMSREGIIVLNEDDLRDINVSVIVRAPRSKMDVLRAALADAERFADIIEVSVDFRAVDSRAVEDANGVSVQLLRVSPNLQPGFEHVSISPPYVEVGLDVSTRQMFPVQTIQHGDVPPGFELQQVTLSIGQVTAIGSRTELRAISLIEAHVDITGVHGDAEILTDLRVLDTYGYYMTDRVHLTVAETTAFVRVWPVRTMDIRVHGAGQPAAGFAVAGISGDLDSVEVVASADVLDEISYILAEIDLTGANANVTQTLAIPDILPDGVSLRRGEYYEIDVTVRIEPIEEREFNVPRGNVRSRGVVGLYQLLDDNAYIRVRISGPRSVIAALSEADISPEFDLRTLPIGVHTVPLLVELPPGLALVGAPLTLLVQIHEPAVDINDDEPDEDVPDDDEPYEPYVPAYYYENGYYYGPYYHEEEEEYEYGVDIIDYD